MRKLALVALSMLLVLSACAPSFQNQQEVVQEKGDSKKKAIIPKYKISDQYYQTILPFEPSQSRGMVVDNINTRYDINEFEMGLMRVAQKSFDPSKYLFQEGQYLKANTVRLWLNRKMTKEQLAGEGLTEEENIGLNPLDDGKGDIDERNKKSPLYLAHVLEQDYLVKDSNGTVSLGGVVIGLALNSIHYYQKELYGANYEVTIGKSELESEGKKIAEEVVKRLRKINGLADVPITIALFEQASKSAIIPGSFFSYAEVSKGSTNIGTWEPINEKHYLFPSGNATKDHREDDAAFQKFKQDIETYFPNFNGVIGKGFYVDDQLSELNISIPIQFYGKTEGVGFTQYVTGLVMKHFPKYVTVSVSITSVNGPESLIVRKANQDEPVVHIY